MNEGAEVYFCNMNIADYQNATPLDREYVELHLRDDVKGLALALSKQQNINREYVLTQIAGRQAIEKKLPSWHKCQQMLFPPHLSLEQCSSELTARYKASLCEGESLTDLTGGFGVDFAFMAPNFKTCRYVEQQELLCFLASHNFKSLGLHHVEIFNTNTIDFLKTMQPQSWVYIDPARRSASGGKTVLLTDCQPDITAIYDELRLKSSALMVKLSPMLDLSLALHGMPRTSQIHVVSVDNECKELLYISEKEIQPQPAIHCINLSESKSVQTFCFFRSEEQEAQCQHTHTMDDYLYEPNSAIMKAGAYKLMATRFGLKKLHPDSHLYTSNQIMKDFPGRIFSVESTFGAGKNEIKRLLSSTSKANITIRNYPGSVDELRKKLKIKDGGDTYLFATTLMHGERAIIKCRKAPQTTSPFDINL